MDMKTTSQCFMGSSVITDLKYFCLPIQWNLFTRQPNKMQDEDLTYNRHRSLTGSGTLSPVTQLNLKRLVFGKGRCFEEWPCAPCAKPNTNRDWSQSQSGNAFFFYHYRFLQMSHHELSERKKSNRAAGKPLLTHLAASALLARTPRVGAQNPTRLDACTNKASTLRPHPAEEQNWMTHYPWPKDAWTHKWKN